MTPPLDSLEGPLSVGGGQTVQSHGTQRSGLTGSASSDGGPRPRAGEPMKILMVHSRLDVRGGAENLLLFLARGLQERGHEVAVAACGFDPNLWPVDEWSGITVHPLRPPERWRRWRKRRMLLFARAVASLSQDADLIVAHNFPACVLATFGWGRRTRPRIVWYCHEPPASLHWRTTHPTLVAAAASRGRVPLMENEARDFVSKLESRHRRRRVVDLQLDLKAVARVDTILANSSFTAKSISAVYGRGAVVCHPGTPQASRRQWPRPTDPHVAWITSPTLPKNALGFLEAIRIAVHERDAHDLRVRAVGIQTPRFRQILREKGIVESVVLEPWQSPEELEEIVATARLVAYVSIDEPFGLVPIEAMAHARPVLASRIGGPHEVVEHDVTGLLVDPLDPRAMADGLLALWRDPDRADLLGAQGFARYLKDFTLENFLDRFESQVFGS